MRKLILAAGAVATLVVPATAMAANGHKASAKGATVKVCVSHKKHGLKARIVSGKCKLGEKAVTLHLPAAAKGATGATGATGAQGPQGPAGNGLVVKDANGNAVGGTPIAYDGAGVWMMLSDGTIEYVDATTGQINYNENQDQFEYTSNDCTGPAYTWGGSAQTPFAAPGQSAVGDPLYVASPLTQSVTVNSVQNAEGGGCSSVNWGPTQVQAVTPTGTTITTTGFTGPLTITK